MATRTSPSPWVPKPRGKQAGFGTRGTPTNDKALPVEMKRLHIRDRLQVVRARDPILTVWLSALLMANAFSVYTSAERGYDIVKQPNGPVRFVILSKPHYGTHFLRDTLSFPPNVTVSDEILEGVCSFRPGKAKASQPSEKNQGASRFREQLDFASGC